MRRIAISLAMLVLVSGIAPAAVGQASGTAYAGTHVSFDTSAHAVTDYAVHGETMIDSVKLRSAESAEGGGLLGGTGASLSAVTSIQAGGVQIGATSETQAKIATESGAEVIAHDNARGVLVVQGDRGGQVVLANLSAGANATAEGDSQVSVTTANGTEGTFLVVGQGNVTVNDDGNVSARLGQDGRLVFRAYPDGKDDADEKQERLIADGKARAEAYVMAESGEVVVDTVSYGRNTTIQTKQTAEGNVSFAVNRTTHEGTVIVASVSEKALNTTEGVDVRVNGEAAVKAATYTQLESAIGSDRSRYLVSSSGDASANASADVLVAVNHFSERTVSLRSEADPAPQTTAAGTTNGSSNGAGTTDGGSGDPTLTDDDENTGNIPGFGVTASVAALVAAVLLTRLR
ncbi:MULTISPECIES: hypothetical protein [Halorussus]|uniref:hypothetical protein n=1 Tax=Halorussus TaxID=1070314 RepID=UPI0020A20BDF|nr:hypothetical protein [Halorussus vallis]USZ74619.1 hypothetical protein NGM07_14380 [Halorussus vallis]